MAFPPEFRPPGVWAPIGTKALVFLPFDPSNRAANPEWLRSVLGPRIRISRDGPAWQIAKSHADTVLNALIERFGQHQTVVVIDTVQQLKCGPACQNANPEFALQCECQCGGANHGGVTWRLFGEYAIDTSRARHVFMA